MWISAFHKPLCTELISLKMEQQMQYWCFPQGQRSCDDGSFLLFPHLQNNISMLKLLQIAPRVLSGYKCPLSLKRLPSLSSWPRIPLVNPVFILGDCLGDGSGSRQHPAVQHRCPSWSQVPGGGETKVWEDSKNPLQHETSASSSPGRGSSGPEGSQPEAARVCWQTMHMGGDPLPAGDVLFSARLFQSSEQGWAHAWDLGQCARVGQPRSMQKLRWVEVWARITSGCWTTGTESTPESTPDQRTSHEHGQT